MQSGIFYVVFLYREDGVNLLKIHQDILLATSNRAQYETQINNIDAAVRRLEGSVTNQQRREYSRNLMSIFNIN